MNGSKSAFIATIVVALLAIAAAVFAIRNVTPEEPGPANFTGADPNLPEHNISRDLEDEMLNAGHQLIANNITIVRLFITHGVPVVREPYANTTDRPLGNPPEDGYFYSASSDFRTIEDVEALVRETFLPEEAERILNNLLDDGEPYYSDFGRIFGEKRPNSDGVTLGVNNRFALESHLDPDFAADFPITWENSEGNSVGFNIFPLSDRECELKITLTVNGEPYVVTRSMTNLDGSGWRIDRLIHE
jgi:hypothetical protein